MQCADERWGEGATTGHDWMRGALRAVLCTCAEPCTCFVNVMSLHVRTFFHVHATVAMRSLLADPARLARRCVR